MNLIDYLVWAFLLGYPIYSFFTYQGEVEAIKGGKKSLISCYTSTIFILWIPAVLVLFSSAFNYSALPVANTANAIAAGLLFLLCVYLITSITRMKKDPDNAQKVLNSMASVAWLMPKSNTQLGVFIIGICTTAGIAEELIYRGYVMPLLSQHMNEYAALVCSSLLFGLPHIYQKVTGVLKTAAVGLCLGGTVLLLESLWLAIALHFIIDAYSGYLYFQAYKIKKSA